VGALPGSHSLRREWEEVGRIGPDHVLVMLCGFGIPRARAELESVSDSHALELLGQVPTWILDANQYTSRPGPRVVEGAEHIHAALTGAFTPQVERWEPAIFGPVPPTPLPDGE
jgi:iron complex transport system substrate-binding protein